MGLKIFISRFTCLVNALNSVLITTTSIKMSVSNAMIPVMDATQETLVLGAANNVLMGTTLYSENALKNAQKEWA